jgi:hypothetical protein
LAAKPVCTTSDIWWTAELCALFDCFGW